MASTWSSEATWAASSRVGVSTSTRGCLGRAGLPCSRATAPIPKARVLPEPVGALPQTSRPARASGMVMAWMGNGSMIDLRSRAATMSEGTPREAKEGCRGGMGRFRATGRDAGVRLGCGLPPKSTHQDVTRLVPRAAPPRRGRRHRPGRARRPGRVRPTSGVAGQSGQSLGARNPAPRPSRSPGPSTTSSPAGSRPGSDRGAPEQLTRTQGLEGGPDLNAGLGGHLGQRARSPRSPGRSRCCRPGRRPWWRPARRRRRRRRRRRSHGSARRRRRW